MASVGTPKTWIPYMNNKDCSQGFCSLYCPQWCYVIFPPPPPFEFPEGSSNSSFSPLVIAIIGILASAFLLASYYTIISKYCGNNNSPRGENHVQNVELDEENHNPSFHEPWHVTPRGLDEALIKSITVCKYKKGDGLIEGADCSVCLGEFEEDQSVRLLPKCSHAFHVPCIDTWLKSHSNCPLCRANIFFASAPTPQLLQLPPQVLIQAPQGNVVSSFQDRQRAGESVAGSDQNMGRVAGEEETEPNDGAAKAAMRALSDLGNLQPRDTIIEIRDEGCLNVRRSVSMDHHSCQNYSNVSSSFAEVLPMKNRIKLVAGEEACSGSTSKQSSARSLMCKSDTHKRKVVLHCVPSPLAMKRSFSSERFFHPNAITPVCGKRMITHQSLCSNSERELQFSSRQSQFQGVAYDEFMF